MHLYIYLSKGTERDAEITNGKSTCCAERSISELYLLLYCVFFVVIFSGEENESSHIIFLQEKVVHLDIYLSKSTERYTEITRYAESISEFYLLLYCIFGVSCSYRRNNKIFYLSEK